MSLYEHVFLARPDISAKRVSDLAENFKGIILQNGGQCGKTEYWGLRSTAFRVGKSHKAHYTLMNIGGPPEAIAEMERLMSIDGDVLRFLTVKVPEWNDEPSPMMQRDARPAGRYQSREQEEGVVDRNGDFAPDRVGADHGSREFQAATPANNSDSNMDVKS